MNKQEFLVLLSEKLYGLPKEETDERLAFYCEIIDDKIEEGIDEEEAVSSIGDIGKIAEQIIAETPFTKIAKERIISKRRLKKWEIILLVPGSPIWVSLGVAAVAVTLAIFVSLWAVIISLWAVFASFVGSSIGSIVGGIVLNINGNIFSGIAMIGAGIVCAGFSIFVFYGCKIATKGILWLTKKFVLWVKNCFIKKEAAL